MWCLLVGFGEWQDCPNSQEKGLFLAPCPSHSPHKSHGKPTPMILLSPSITFTYFHGSRHQQKLVEPAPGVACGMQALNPPPPILSLPQWEAGCCQSGDGLSSWGGGRGGLNNSLMPGGQAGKAQSWMLRPMTGLSQPSGCSGNCTEVQLDCSWRI